MTPKQPSKTSPDNIRARDLFASGCWRIVRLASGETSTVGMYSQPRIMFVSRGCAEVTEAGTDNNSSSSHESNVDACADTDTNDTATAIANPDTVDSPRRVSAGEMLLIRPLHSLTLRAREESRVMICLLGSGSDREQAVIVEALRRSEVLAYGDYIGTLLCWMYDQLTEEVVSRGVDDLAMRMLIQRLAELTGDI